MGFLDAVTNLAGDLFADERQEDSQQFAAGQAHLDRQWKSHMRATQYQTAVTDMERAGLNPMLAYHQGGAGTPTGSPASSGIAGSPGKLSPTAAMQSASQIEVNEAIAEKTKAEAREIEARTPTHAVTIDKMKQEIGESATRIEKLWQDVQTGASSARLMDQQRTNLQAEIPKIRETVQLLKAQTGLESTLDDQAKQRIKQNLPQLEAAALALENKLQEIQQPGHYQQSDVKTSFIGLLGDYLKALLPINSYIGTGKTSNRTTIINRRK